MRFHPTALARVVGAPYSLGALGVLLLATSGPDAQTLYGFDAAGVALEFTGPPAPPCGYPSGPGVFGFPTPAPFLCATAGPVGLPLGDIAVDKRNDTVWVTDGFVFTEYNAAGAPIRSFPLPAFAPGPASGLGFDTIAGDLWVTDGAIAWSMTPPPAPACGVAPPVLTTPPFALPVPAFATDIEWDSRTGTLWVCDLSGQVTNVVVGGGFGPFGFFNGAALCPLAPALQGIAVDDASAALGVVYVTDGVGVAYLDAATGGGPAPLTFYTTANCFPQPSGGVLAGLAFTAHAIAYGAGSTNAGGVGPVLAGIGHTTSPNPGFAMALTGAAPGGLAALFYGQIGAACPPIGVAGVSLLVIPPLFAVGGSVPVPASGALTLAAPIPPGIVSASFFLQCVVVAPPLLQLSNGLELTGSAF